jgi:uncharacterized protein
MNSLMKFRVVKYFFLLSLIFCAVPAWSQDDDVSRQPVPDYYGLVNDFAGALDDNSEKTLEAKLRAYEDSTTTQIVVVIEQSLNERAQFERSMDFVRGWKIGSKANNNGVLIYIAIKEQKISIRNSNEIMSKMTGSETDAIIRNYMAPYLRKGDYYNALDQASSAVMLALAGRFKADGKNLTDKAPGWVFFVVVFLVMMLIAFINNRRGGRGIRSGGAFWIPFGGFGGGSGWGGGGSGGGGWGGMGGGGGFDGGGADGGW